MSSLALDAKGLSKAYKIGTSRQQVLKNVNFTAYHGQVTMVMGPSGSGKSTLIAALSGLMKPDEGDVQALGESLWTKSARKVDKFRLDHCGFIFQGFNLFPALDATAQVVQILRYCGVGKRESLARATAVLEAVGLGARLHQKPAELSGGEKQRVAIARALAKSPALIFADEPTSALDSVNGQVVIKLLHQAAQQRNAAIVVVTHDPRLETHADRIIHMEDGKILSDRMLSEPPATAAAPRCTNLVTRERPNSTTLALWTIALAGLSLTGCRQSGAGAPAAAPLSPFATIANGKVDIEGGVVEVAARRFGVIKDVLVHEGDVVKKGQVLARQEDRDSILAIDSARATLVQAQSQLVLTQVNIRTAEREYERLKKLAATNSVALQQLDQAADTVATAQAQLGIQQAAIETARAQLAQAQYNAELTNIRAPLDGKIIRRYANPGAGASTLNVSTMFDLEPALPHIIRAEIVESAIPDVRVGQEAQIVPETDPSKVSMGHVIRIAATFGARKLKSDAANEASDERVVEVVVSADNAPFLIGQRVLVKFMKPDQPAHGAT